MTLPSKGPNSPFSAGQRTVLARTCVECGELADGDSFPQINKGRGGRRKVCHKCHNAQKKKDREERGIGLPPTVRPPEELQHSKYRQWTKDDDRILQLRLEAGQPYEEIAVALGRSMRSVYKRRADLGLATVRIKHRVEKPWKIQ